MALSFSAAQVAFGLFYTESSKSKRDCRTGLEYCTRPLSTKVMSLELN
jgi:hypothetical protein